MISFNSILLQMNAPQHMMDGWGGFTMFFMIFFWLLIVGLIITLIWFLIKKGGESSTNPSDESSIEILKKRYARGELDEEEYRRIREEITE